MHDYIASNVKNLIIQRVSIVFSPTIARAHADRALMLLTLLSPNNIYFSEYCETDENYSLKIAYSLPVSWKKFSRIIEVMKDSQIDVLGWEKLN